jgi:hypothetical protein
VNHAVHLTPGLWERARELRGEREARRPDDDGIRRIVTRLRELADGQDILEYLRQRVESMDLSSPHDGATLWAWRTEDPSTGDFVGNRYVAHAWAEHINRTHPDQPVTVIHLTPGGAEMDQHWLNDDRVLNALDLDGAEVRAVWDRLSERYAEQIDGHVVIFAERAHTEAILYTTELPAVRRTLTAGADRAVFAHPPPKELPDDVRELLEPGPVRARLQLDDPALPGYLDTAALAGLPRAEQQTRLSAVMAAVDTADRDAARRAPAGRGGSDAERYEKVAHAVLGDRAGPVLADPAWPAVTDALARGEAMGLDPRQTLSAGLPKRGAGARGSFADALHQRVERYLDVRQRTGVTGTGRDEGRGPAPGAAEPPRRRAAAVRAATEEKVRRPAPAPRRTAAHDDLHVSPRRDGHTLK